MTTVPSSSPYDVTPPEALARLHAHEGPVVVDLDETLLLRNSTATFLAAARPALVVYALIKVLDVIRPWRWSGGAATRDGWRVRAVLTLLPWTGRRWRRLAPEVARKLVNDPLLCCLRAHDGPVVVATLGFVPIVEPLVDALGLPDVRVVAMDPRRSGDRLRGKLALTEDALGADKVAESLVVTDSLDDADLLAAAKVPLRVLWPDAGPTEPFPSAYLPFRYLSAVKRPNSRYVRKILKEDVGLWVLGSVWLADQPVTHVAGLLLLALSFWSIYELGYIDNDRMAERWEHDPTLSDEYHRAPLSIPRWKPVVWSLVLGVAGLWVLRLPGRPDAIDHLRWASVLAAVTVVFTVYNRLDKQTRILLFPLLQLLRVGSFLALVPTTAIADMALVVQVLIRWFNYYLYRTRDGRWPTDDLSSIRLIVFCAAAVMLAAQHEWTDLVAPTTLSLLAWNLVLARRTLPAALRRAHRIDRPEPSSSAPPSR